MGSDRSSSRRHAGRWERRIGDRLDRLSRALDPVKEETAGPRSRWTTIIGDSPRLPPPDGIDTVMERSRTPLSTWFWAAYLVASQTKGMSAVQFQRQLGLSRYETAFGILHKLRAGMVRPDRRRRR